MKNLRSTSVTKTVIQKRQMQNNPFQIREPNILENGRIRIPQREAYAEAFRSQAKPPSLSAALHGQPIRRVHAPLRCRVL
jgi:hypothetical protein